MNDADQLISTRMWISMINIDLQLYKGSIYKLRWGTPGGIDQALPCYDEALSALRATPWPSAVGEWASRLAERIEAFQATLRSKDVTSASAEQTRMTNAFTELREAVRAWPNAPVAVAASSDGHEPRPMDEVLPSM